MDKTKAESQNLKVELKREKKVIDVINNKFKIKNGRGIDISTRIRAEIVIDLINNKFKIKNGRGIDISTRIRAEESIYRLPCGSR